MLQDIWWELADLVGSEALCTLLRTVVGPENAQYKDCTKSTVYLPRVFPLKALSDRGICDMFDLTPNLQHRTHSPHPRCSRQNPLPLPLCNTTPTFPPFKTSSNTSRATSAVCYQNAPNATLKPMHCSPQTQSTSTTTALRML